MCTHGHAEGQPLNAAQEQPGKLVDLSRLPRRDLIRGLAAGTILVAAPGCSTNPETGRNQLMLVNDGALASMALDAWREEKSKTPIYQDRAANDRLRRVGERIAVAANRPNDPWEFVVFNKPDKNAFVLPGGKVGFYKGLLDLTENDDQIATVLGHEVGHVTGRHAAERYSLQMSGQLAMLGAQAATRNASADTRNAGMQALGLGLMLGVVLPYSRDHESEADRLGLNYMHAAGYNPRQAVTFWQRMSQSGGPRQPEFLSTHPEPANRIRAIQTYIINQGW